MKNKLFTGKILSLFLVGCTVASPDERIEKKRKKIDQIDQKVITLLSLRMRTAMDIGIIKKENNMEVTQPSRWNKVQNLLRKTAIEKGANPEMIIKMYEVFYEESVHRQLNLQKSQK